MPGYIHTCQKCGAHMQVHERYLGRTLRCTSCRSEFLAMLPTDVEVETAPPPEVELPDDGRRWTRHLKWLTLVVPLAIVVWWLGQNPSGTVGRTLLEGSRATGEIGELDNGSDAGIVVAMDSEVGKALLRSDGSPDDADLRALIEEGRAVVMERGTRVRVIAGSAKGGRLVQVRVIAGPWESRKVWVPTLWIR